MLPNLPFIIHHTIRLYVDQNSSVGIATRYRPDGPRIESVTDPGGRAVCGCSHAGVAGSSSAEEYGCVFSTVRTKGKMQDTPDKRNKYG
jgi:hypothetical protein